MVIFGSGRMSPPKAFCQLELERRTNSKVRVVECKSRKKGEKYWRAYFGTDAPVELALESGHLVTSKGSELAMDVLKP